MGYPRISLRIGEWPDIDRRCWERASAVTGPLEPEGRVAGWAPKTANQVAKDYGRFLFWLRAEGRLDDVRSPGDRLVHDHLSGYIANLRATGMASTSLLSRVRNLRQAVLAMDPAANLRLLDSACSKLKARAKPVRDKQARVVSSAVLAEAAARHYADWAAGEGPVRGRACDRARDALMMLFLAYVPLRLASFAGLRIGRQIVRPEDCWRLRLNAADLKEDLPYDCAVPADLTAVLDHYVAEIRPQLLHGKDSDHLWVSMRGSGMSESAIYDQITKLTERLIGHEINPHAFRDCMMTTLATEAPESVRAGARILGHHGLTTSEKHYNFATAIAAQRRHFQALKQLRQAEDDE